MSDASHEQISNEGAALAPKQYEGDELFDVLSDIAKKREPTVITLTTKSDEEIHCCIVWFEDDDIAKSDRKPETRYDADNDLIRLIIEPREDVEGNSHRELLAIHAGSTIPYHLNKAPVVGTITIFH